MAVYQYGSKPLSWAVPLSSGILEYRKQVAAEQEAAKKAAEKAQKAAKAAMKKAAKDREIAETAARRASVFDNDDTMYTLGAALNRDESRIQAGRFRTASGAQATLDADQDRAGAILKELKISRDEATRRYKRRGKLSADRDTLYETRLKKELANIAKAKKAKATSSKKGTGVEKVDKNRYTGRMQNTIPPSQMTPFRMGQYKMGKIPADEFFGLTGQALGFDPGNNRTVYSDLDRAQFVEQRAAEEATAAANEQRSIIANADMQDEIRQEAKDKLAARLAEAEMQAANEAAAIKNEAAAIKASKTSFGTEAALANRAGWNNRFYKNIETIPSVADSGQSRKMPLALRNLIRRKTYTEKVAPENKYEMSPDFPWKGRLAQPTFVKHVPSQERIDAMTALVADTALQRTSGDAVARAAHVISGYTGGEQLVIQDQINELVLKGEATLVELKGHGENMTAVAVTADGLLDQLRDQIPGFIDGGPKPITNYNGVLVEYHPEIDKHFILQKIGGF